MSELSPELGDFSMSQALIARCVEQGTGNKFYLSLTSSGRVEKESLRRLVAIYQSVIYEIYNI